MTIGTAYYDLATSPPTFNAFDFLLAAELWRRQRGLARLSVRVLPGPAHGFRHDDLPPYGAAERRRWLENIVLPMAALLPSCGVPAIEAARDDAPDGPEYGRGQYLIGFKWNTAAAAADLYPFRAAPDRVAFYRARFGARVVTITLRDTGWWVERTSNLAAWIAVADALSARGWRVVFVPDGCQAYTPVRDFITVPEAALLVSERAALYAASRLNMGIGNGPMWLAWFMGVPTLILVKLNENEPCAGRNAYERQGLKVGDQLPNARPGQWLEWGPDDVETIERGLTRVAAALDG